MVEIEQTLKTFLSKRGYSILKDEFDIDVEISSTLVSIYPNFKKVNIEYKRRCKSEGKKLRLVDSFKIIFRI